MGKGYGLEVKKCKECGKVFCPPFPELWAYKRSFRWYCSYGCMRKAQVRETPKVKKTQGFAPRKRVEAIDAETGQVVAEWETMTQMSDRSASSSGCASMAISSSNAGAAGTCRHSAAWKKDFSR